MKYHTEYNVYVSAILKYYVFTVEILTNSSEIYIKQINIIYTYYKIFLSYYRFIPISFRIHSII